MVLRIQSTQRQYELRLKTLWNLRLLASIFWRHFLVMSMVLKAWRIRITIWVGMFVINETGYIMFFLLTNMSDWLLSERLLRGKYSWCFMGLQEILKSRIASNMELPRLL